MSNYRGTRSSDMEMKGAIPKTVREEKYHLQYVLEMSLKAAKKEAERQQKNNVHLQKALAESKKTRRISAASNFPLDDKILAEIYLTPQKNSSTGNSPSMKESKKEHKSEEIEINCPVCLDDARNILAEKRRLMVTVCGHFHCDTCLNGIMAKSKKCSRCRTRLSTKDYHPMYL